MMMTQADDQRTTDRFFSEEDLQIETPSNGHELVVPEDSVATTKEEEWVTKKKIELTTTRQIETRVKRQVVLEDGKVVEDTGPLVTTSTTEDTEKQEHSQTEHRTLGDEDGVTKWTPELHAGDHVKEVQEKTVKSREEKEERTETEKVRHLGDISDEGYLTAIKSGSDDVREALQVSDGKELIETAPKVIHQSLKIRKYVDSEDKSELSRIQPGGKIINETKTIRLQEQVNDCNVSDEDEHSSGNVDFYEMTKKENSEKYRKTKEQEFTEYLANGRKIGEKLHFQAETSEAERRGDHLGCDDDDDYYYYYADDYNRNTVASRLKRIKMRGHKSSAFVGNERFPTFKKSSDFDHQEETRKEETSKWLEHHFGSESTRSSKASLDDLDDVIPSTQNSFINVTMKSQLNAARRQEACPTSKEIAQKAGKESFFSTEKESLSSMRIRNRDVEEDRPRVTESMFQGMKRDLSEADRLSPTGDSCGLESENCYIHEAQNRRTRLPVQSHATYLGPDLDSHSDRFTRSDETLSPDEVKAVPTCDNEFKSCSPESATTKDGSPSSRSPSSKKLYQRTRFAADIPPPPPQAKDPHQPVGKGKSKFGDGFRKLMDKLRSTSNERKNKKRSRGNESRSPSPKENTYQNYNSLDNYGSLTAGTDHYCERGDFRSEDPVPPPRTRHQAARSRLSAEPKSLQRYYLGEDPFAVSIYGREKEYGNGETRGLADFLGENEFKARTLGRLSKSTSRLTTTATTRTAAATIPTNNTSTSQNRGGVQTLPRKLHGNEKLTNKNLEKTDASKELGNGARQVDRWEHLADGKPMTHARSLINVSFVNRPRSPFHWISNTNEVKSACRGPAKPARTYRSNLLRSQSFSVQPRQEAAFSLRSAQSPPRGLRQSPPPLESPGMIHQWHRRHRHQSNEDSPSLGGSRAVHGTLAKPTLRLLGGDRVKSVDHGSSFRSTSTVNTSDSRSTPDGYQGYAFKSERPLPGAPRVFTRTFQNGNVVQTVSTSETSGKDDYSETVRIESKSDDPLSPSETNTVKIFSKKKIPSREGHGYETIESSETKTVVKSHGLRAPPMARNVGPPGGVVIKVKAP